MYDFADRDHANNYLGNTIIRHAGRPTYVQGVDYTPRKKLQVHHSPLPHGLMGMEVHKIDDPGFDFKPLKLGMFNLTLHGNIVEALWLQRYPARRWKVGLDKGGMAICPVRKAEDNIMFEVMRGRVHMDPHWTVSQDMADSLNAKYPTFHEALAIMGKRTRCSVAFAPSWAVTGDRKLWYRHNGEAVGEVRDEKPELYAQYSDLLDVLQEEFR